ncbi:MAG TPA: helix-turn-helix transcriptional regulator [Acidobacteriota bacterium]|nr:helix-turn-helix transcriptional regulator [Acidobacteriota bacterium]
MDAIEELKKGTGEMLVLCVLAHKPRYGYDIAGEIGRLTEGAVSYKAASLYPLLYRMERRKWIEGRWVEKAGQRRRRYYRVTDRGQEILRSKSKSWEGFVRAIDKVLEVQHA